MASESAVVVRVVEIVLLAVTVLRAVIVAVVGGPELPVDSTTVTFV